MTNFFAIIGAGPWGLAVLDRMVAVAARSPEVSFRATLIDPSVPGPGAHRTDQEPYLLLNTVTGQIDSFSARHFGERPLCGALPFIGWLRECRGITADPDGFLARSLFGEYLRYVYGVLLSNAPPNLLIDWERDVAVGLQLAANGRPEVTLGGDAQLEFDHVFICTGHGLPAVARKSLAASIGVSHVVEPYPVETLQEAVDPGATVGIAGMGLTAVDAVATLTEGRGGRFEESEDDSLTYVPSGREPTLYVFSRTGIPFSCRPASSFDLSTIYEPLFCRPEILTERRRPHSLDTLLKLLCAEMGAAYLVRSTALTEGCQAAEDAFGRLQSLGTEAALHVVDRIDRQEFDPESLIQPRGSDSFSSSADFSMAFARRLEFDVREAAKGEAGSPYKYAVEMLRVVRPFIRDCVAHEALFQEERRIFFDEIAPRIAQLVVGPPIVRGRQWLALMRAGVIKVALGPAPDLHRDFSRRLWQARSTRFEQPLTTCLDVIVRGRLSHDPVRFGGSLLHACHQDGLFAAAPHRIAGGKVSIIPRTDRQGHPFDATGNLVTAVTLLGGPNEGATYFNHYLPSPKSRSRAFEQIQEAIDFACGREELKRLRGHPGETQDRGRAPLAGEWLEAEHLADDLPAAVQL